ncbi:MAG: hypothetical protein JW754_02635 [Candidatus Aenigmarchaeota archaeon]|nr:hypothetical protein [Candidatus Aenigmarchaeota archaeon]
MATHKFLWIFVLLGMIFIIANSGCITGYFIQRAEPLCGNAEVSSVHACVDNYLKVVYETPGKGFELIAIDDSVISCPLVAPGQESDACKMAMQPGFCDEADLCTSFREPVLSRCDCECYRSGEEPKETNECTMDCDLQYGILGCEYSGGEFVKTYTAELSKITAEKEIRKSETYLTKNGRDITFQNVRQLDCRFCWEYVYSFVTDSSTKDVVDTYEAIVVVENGKVESIKINQLTRGCEFNVDCRGMGCTHLYPNAKCSEFGECYCASCCQTDEQCDYLNPEYICRERECHSRIYPGTLPPAKGDCMDRYGEYSNGVCVLPDGSVCTDDQYFSGGCYGKQLNS